MEIFRHELSEGIQGISYGSTGDRAEQPSLVLAHLNPEASQCDDDRETTYDYKPVAETEIRLLQVEHSSESSSALHASLRHMPLLSARAKGYIALSYTWGDLPATSHISIDGKNLRIRPNLAEILRKMRSFGYDLIWVRSMHDSSKFGF